jgi:hypothetical protein
VSLGTLSTPYRQIARSVPALPYGRGWYFCILDVRGRGKAGLAVTKLLFAGRRRGGPLSRSPRLPAAAHDHSTTRRHDVFLAGHPPAVTTIGRAWDPARGASRANTSSPSAIALRPSPRTSSYAHPERFSVGGAAAQHGDVARCGLAAPVTEKRIGRSRCPEARLWRLNGVRSRGPRGDGSRSIIDARTRLVTTGVRGAPRRPGRERRAVHGRCHQPRRTRRAELGPVECRRDAATVRAGDHHEVSGLTNRARAAGTSRSMRVISP